MSEQTIALILVFVFAVIALIALGARSFTRLVELLLENGYKLEALRRELPQALTHLSREKGHKSSSPLREDTLTTPEEASSSLTDSTGETK
jgi:hypothetical protein